MNFLTNYFNSISSVLILFMLLSIIIFCRYLIPSGVYHYLIYKFLKRKKSKKILQTQNFSSSQVRSEIIRSGVSSMIFSVFAVLLVYQYFQGWTKVYLDWPEYPVWVHLTSIPLYLFLQDTYYYWVHRWMHKPNIYRIVHKWHHDSIYTSSLTSFSFHPLETIIQAVIFPILLFFIPIHLYSLAFILFFMTVTAIINHGAVEIYPSGILGQWIRKWLIGATHHDQHHIRAKYNFGLYFTLWDRLMQTEKLEFEE